ncbi:hypothetical protein BH10BAC5_BH10BAC5_00060 [soil metagenome]
MIVRSLFLITFIFTICNVNAQNKTDDVLGMECFLGNIYNIGTMYIDEYPQGRSYMEKFYPSKSFFEKTVKNQIPGLKIVDKFAQCTIMLQFDIDDDVFDNADEVSYGNIEISIHRKAKIEDVQCSLLLGYNIYNYRTKVLFMNPKSSSANYRKIIEQYVENLITQFAADYYKAN